MLSPTNRELCDNLIHNIITLRKRHGLSQRAMAGILGISPRSLRILERGERLPNVDVAFILRMQEHFGVSVKELFGTRL